MVLLVFCLRFYIHLYNVDSLLACVLPYHETKVFVRVVQLLKIKDPTNRWNWLEVLQVTFQGPGQAVPNRYVNTRVLLNGLDRYSKLKVVISV